MTKSATLYLIYIAFLVAACGSQDPQAIQQRVELKRFDSCSQLESYIKSVAIREMELRIDDSIESLRQWTWGPTGGADAGAMMSADGAAAPSPSQPGDKSADGPAAHTTTNTQVEDVDEPDFIKNDGKRILVLTNDQNGGRLYAAKSWPPSALSLAGSLSIEGHPTQMFLDGDRVVVFSYVSTQSLKSGGSCVGDYSCYQSYGNALKITVVSVKDLSKPVVVSEVLLPGRYRAARRVGSAVRIVLSDYFRWPEGVRFYPEYDPGRSYDDQEATIEAYHALKEKNRQLIAGSLGSWVFGGMGSWNDDGIGDGGLGSDLYKAIHESIAVAVNTPD